MLIQNLFETLLLERHIDVVRALEQYRDDDNIYISFTDDVGDISHRLAGKRRDIGRNVSGAKIGINPKSIYSETPIAIYAYPLKLIWPRLVRDTIPFASDRKYIQLFRARGEVLNLTEMTEDELTDYSLQLQDRFEGALHFSDEEAEDIKTWGDFEDYCRMKALVDSPGGYFWSMTQQIAQRLNSKNDKAPIRWNAIMRGLDLAGCRDDGKSIIHENEPTQACFFSINAIALVETLPNIRKAEKSPDSFHKTFRSLDQLEQWLNAHHDDEIMVAKMLAAQLPVLLSTGKSKNFRLGDGVLESLHHPEEFVGQMIEWRGAKAIIPVLELMRSEKFATPACAEALVQNLLRGRRPNDAMRLMTGRAANVLARALGKNKNEAVRWVADKVAMKAIFEYAFSNPVDGFAIGAVTDVLDDELGKDKAAMLQSLLGDERLLQIAQIAATNFPH